MIAAAALIGACSDGFSGKGSRPNVVVVFAAVSTSDVVSEAARLYMERDPTTRIDCSFDASSNLAKQIKAGAPAQIFISADVRWMDDLASAQAIEPHSRTELFSNELVLIALKGHPLMSGAQAEFDIAAGLKQVHRIAIGDPSHVPAGRYAKQALESLNCWSDAEQRLLPAQDVRSALRLVERGEADVGIVYRTDANASNLVQILATFPADSHERITYPAALCRSAGEPAARFFDYLRSPEARELYRKHGFNVAER